MAPISRRRILQVCGVLTLSSFAGCLAEDSGSDSEPTPTPDQSGDSDSDDNDDDSGSGLDFETKKSDVVAYDPSGSADVGVFVGPEDGPHFEPEELEIEAGEEVQWRWETGGHSIVIVSQPDDATWSGTEVKDEGTRVSRTFDTPGEYEYECGEHEDSSAVLIVN